MGRLIGFVASLLVSFAALGQPVLAEIVAPENGCCSVAPNPARFCSFSAETEVLMADGTTKAISEIEVGDWVLAEDPDTGEHGPREVIVSLPHTDQLLILRTRSGEIVTTEDHPFWNATEQEWQESQDLDPGDQLLNAYDGLVTVVGLDWSTVHTAPAYDLDVAGIDTYYVATGDVEVLVHNCNLTARAGELRAGAGVNRVEIETPNGRMTIDLEGASHFEKTLQTDVATPHVKFETRHVGPNGYVSYTSGPVRPATHDDLRLVDRVLTDRGL